MVQDSISTPALNGPAMGLYGGSFDPVHLGHLAVARAAAGAFELQKVLFMPAARPPHKPGRRLAGGRDRLAMLELALAEQPDFEVSSLELEREGPSFSIDTVRTLLAAGLAPEGGLHLILGTDNLPGLPGWREAEALLELVQPIVLVRAGDSAQQLEALAGRISASALERLERGFLDLPPTPGRATHLRAALGRGLASHADLCPAVADYALRRGLYGPVGGAV
ncbi:MAG: nicotinate-nucleotide adenylyltransferase [Planctomycetota bacterium]